MTLIKDGDKYIIHANPKLADIFLTARNINKDSFEITKPELHLAAVHCQVDPSAEPDVVSVYRYIDLVSDLKKIEPIKEMNPPGFFVDIRTEQHNSIYVMSKIKSFALSDATGTGKTIAAVGGICEHRDFSIIVAEAQKTVDWFAFIKNNTDLKAINLYSKPGKLRKKIITKDAHKYDVIITGYEIAQRDINELCALAKTRQTRLYLDESSRISNVDTMAHKKLIQLSMLCYGRYIMNATVFEGKLSEWFATLRFIMPHDFTDIARFLKRHCNVNTKFSYISGFKRLTEFQERIKPFFISRSKEAVDKASGINNKERTDTLILVGMTPDQREYYDALQKDIDRLKLTIYGSKELKIKPASNEKAQYLNVIKNRAVLRQIRVCISLRLCNIQQAANPKYEALLDVIDKLDGKKAIVFSKWVDTAEWILSCQPPFSYMTVAGSGSIYKGQIKKKLEDFKNNDKQILLASDAIKRGFDIDVADAVICLDAPKNPAVLVQRAGRIDRGNKTKIDFYYIIAKDTREHELFNKCIKNIEFLNEMQNWENHEIQIDDRTIIK